MDGLDLKSILDCVGNTPLVKLRKFSSESVEVFAKLEGLNPTGSMKDRIALYMIENAEKEGALKPNYTILESSSGNMGVSLACIGAVKGYNVLIVADPKLPLPLRRKIEAYGGEIIEVTDKDDTMNYLKERIKEVKTLAKNTPNSWWACQYENKFNYLAHYETTGKEIVNDFVEMKKQIDFIFIPVSTGGTCVGVGRRVKESFPDCKVIAIDVKGSAIFSKNVFARNVSGIGASFRTEIIDENLDVIDEVMLVDGEDSEKFSYLLARKEGIFAGWSSGCVIDALTTFISQRYSGNDGKKRVNVVAILPDRGENYLDHTKNGEGQI